MTILQTIDASDIRDFINTVEVDFLDFLNKEWNEIKDHLEILIKIQEGSK